MHLDFTLFFVTSLGLLMVKKSLTIVWKDVGRDSLVLFWARFTKTLSFLAYTRKEIIYLLYFIWYSDYNYITKKYFMLSI